MQLRLMLTAVPEQRFDAHGGEVLQLRGRVIDSSMQHPQVVVRFRGQHQAELLRWARPDKHLSVEGWLEVKTWTTRGERRVALLVETQSIFPLSDVESLSRIGVYATGQEMAATSTITPPATRATRGKVMRNLLARADG